MAVSQYSRSVLWLGKGLLGESRYKICIVTEAASWLGAGLGVQGAAARSRSEGMARARGGCAGCRRQARARAGSGTTWARRGARSAGGRAVRARPGRWARGLAKAVHLVHSACFWPGLTRYFPESNFWTLFANPVHEHCSSQIFSKFFLLN